MFEATSADIRRFFDLLGAFFYSLVGSFMLWKDEFPSSLNYRFILLPLFIFAGVSIFLSLHHLVWRFVNTRFLLGYANFLIISALSVTTTVVLLVIVGAAVRQNSALSFHRLELFYLRTSLTEVILFYWATSLPMAFFWMVGWLTAWKFSRRNFLR